MDESSGQLHQDQPAGALPPLPVSAAIEPSPPSRPAVGRVDSIDLLRGIVMVIMMLDHTRDFVHRDMLQGFDPTDLSRTNVILFFTRWITHFCAPVFVFLAGTGSYLQWARGKSKRELSTFLLTRGLWLIVLEFTLVRLFVFFHVDYRVLGPAQVIWVIGISMIILAGLIHLPLRAIAVFGVGMILLHNLLDGIRVQGWQGPNTPVPGLWAKLWIILHQPFEAVPVAGFPSPVIFVIYPIIPWVGVMAAGYAFGALYQMDAERRHKLLIRIGSTATALFIILRLINRYGDPSRWSRQDSWMFTLLSFLNTTKYPPSLLFLLMTLGPALVMLAWFESEPASIREPPHSLANRVRRFFVTFGRVPLFFYLLQWLTAHLISVVLHWAAGKPVAWMFSSETMLSGPPSGMGFSLAVVYASWIVGVILLYPLCKWFAGVKARRRDWWLSYL
ncbi:MAG: heparan-alpha-glucosaminide N-acetyltransferase domain-containing protein [Acidobacteriota bacterium]